MRGSRARAMRSTFSSSATFCGAVERGDRIHRRVEHAAAGQARGRLQLDAAALPGGGDRAHGARRVHQRRLGDVVGIGEGGLLAGDGAHAHALVDAEAAALDDAFLEAPAFAARVLEVEVGVVDPVRGDRRQRAGQGRFAEAEGLEQQASGRWPGARSSVRGKSWSSRRSRKSRRIVGAAPASQTFTPCRSSGAHLVAMRLDGDRAIVRRRGPRCLRSAVSPQPPRAVLGLEPRRARVEAHCAARRRSPRPGHRLLERQRASSGRSSASCVGRRAPLAPRRRGACSTTTNSPRARFASAASHAGKLARPAGWPRSRTAW